MDVFCPGPAVGVGSDASGGFAFRLPVWVWHTGLDPNFHPPVAHSASPLFLLASTVCKDRFVDGQRIDLEGRVLFFMHFRHMPTHRGTPPEHANVPGDVRASKLVLAMS